jgi:TRAP-type mannitol/chloroaromatic compound transport system permease small subunit
MNALLKASNAADRALRTIAKAASWLLLVLTALICFEILCRKLQISLPFTKFQELEWHLHTAIFSLWLGFNYTINAHPRVDSYVADFSPRRKAAIELAGCLVFALPYVAAVIYYGWSFVEHSWRANEHSEAANGLPYRWIVKAILLAGLILLLGAIVSVAARLIVFLSGHRSAAESGVKLGPSASEV